MIRSLAKDRFERYQTAADFRARPRDRRSPARCRTASPVADDFNSTLFGVNPNATAASEATLRRLADDTDDRVPRTQTRPPVAWIWGGIAHHRRARRRRGVLDRSTCARPTIVGGNVAVEVPDIVGQTYEDGGNELLELGLGPVKIDVPSDDDADRHRSSPRPRGRHQGRPRPGGRGSRSRPGRRRVALVGLTFKTEQQAKDIIAELELVYGETTAGVLAERAEGPVIGIQLPPRRRR